MSYQTLDGLRADAPQMTDSSNLVLVELQRRWAGKNPSRLRALAAVTLHANGWSYRMISAAMGWAKHSTALRCVTRTTEQLREFFSDLNRNDAGMRAA